MKSILLWVVVFLACFGGAFSGPSKVALPNASLQADVEQVMPSVLSRLNLTDYKLGQLLEAWRTLLGRGDLVEFKFELVIALQHKDTALQQLMPSKLDMKIKVLGLSQLIVEPKFCLHKLFILQFAFHVYQPLLVGRRSYSVHPTSYQIMEGSNQKTGTDEDDITISNVK